MLLCLKGALTEINELNVKSYIIVHSLVTLCYTEKYVWSKWCYLYNFDHAEYESGNKKFLSRHIFSEILISIFSLSESNLNYESIFKYHLLC